MSCFIMSANALQTLAYTLECIGNHGYNFFGFEFPESLHKALSDCKDCFWHYNSYKIFAKLYILNTNAYISNLKAAEIIELETELIPEKPNVPSIIELRQYAHQHDIIQPWHYQFCKLLDCLIYQCNEDATRNDPLLLALKEFSISYKSFLVSNTDEYHNAPWGMV